MTLNEYLIKNNVTKYALSKKSGIPKTTILDICSGKTKLINCSCKTVYLISKALGISMEEILSFDLEVRE